MQNVPERIYLVVGEEAEDDDDFAKWRWDAEVLWSDDEVNENDIKYIRADLAQSVPEDVRKTILQLLLKDEIVIRNYRGGLLNEKGEKLADWLATE